MSVRKGLRWQVTWPEKCMPAPSSGKLAALQEFAPTTSVEICGIEYVPTLNFG
jgi:hypothetical protein